MRFIRFNAAWLTLLFVLGGCSLIRQATRHHHTDRDDDDQPLETFEYAGPIPAVREGHPRLMIEKRGGQYDNVAFANRWRALLIARGQELLKQPPIDYSAKALLTRSRNALQRISLLAGLYQITHDRVWAEASRRELLNVCSFRDWQPNDFLATAEMMNAVGIGYDWTYDALSDDDRRTIQDAIIIKGLTPALTAYQSRGGWTTAHHNWNLVCNGGVIVASLAIADERPQPAQRCLSQALNSIQNGLAAYDEAGGTAEGPMYHNYATRYLTFAAAALETGMQNPPPFLGSKYRGWVKAGDYRIAMTGPSGKVANFGDSADMVGNSAWMFWYAEHFFNRSDYAAFEEKHDRDEPSIFDYIWYTVEQRSFNEPASNIQQFGSAVVLRSTVDLSSGGLAYYHPEDLANRTFLAARIGSTADNHTHLDLGSFVLDMLGQRFAADLGADNYDMPGYLGPRRAEYLRSSTPGHNTLSIAGASQPIDAHATAEVVASDARRSVVRIDLTAAYPDADRVTREIGVDASGSVGITDRIKLDDRAPVIWNLHTPAKVTPGKHGVLLEINGKRVQMNVVQPANARIQISPDETDPPALPIEGSTHIRVSAGEDKETVFQIEFMPLK